MVILINAKLNKNWDGERYFYPVLINLEYFYVGRKMTQCSKAGLSLMVRNLIRIMNEE